MDSVALTICVAAIAAVVGFFYTLCFSPSSNSILANAKWSTHVTVAMAIVPLAAFIAIALSVSASVMVESMKSSVQSIADALPPQVLRLIQGVRPVDASTCFSDVEVIALLLLLAYGSVLVCRHLIDIQRLLKVSRRRLLQPEMEELKKMDKGQAGPSGKKAK